MSIWGLNTWISMVKKLIYLPTLTSVGWRSSYTTIGWILSSPPSFPVDGCGGQIDTMGTRTPFLPICRKMSYDWNKQPRMLGLSKLTRCAAILPMSPITKTVAHSSNVTYQGYITMYIVNADLSDRTSKPPRSSRSFGSQIYLLIQHSTPSFFPLSKSH